MPRIRIWKILVYFSISMWILVFLLGLHYFFSGDISKANFRKSIYSISYHGERTHNSSSGKYVRFLPYNSLIHRTQQYNSSYELNLPSKSKSEKYNKMWFMEGGNLNPVTLKRYDNLKLWPEEADSDRIIDQLMYLPKPYAKDNVVNTLRQRMVNSRISLKTILLVGDFKNTNISTGRKKFIEDKCPVNTCSLLGMLDEDDLDHRYDPDAVIFKEKFMSRIYDFLNRTSQQIWILYVLESPVWSNTMENLLDVFNWTASYRHDSEIVTPYDKFLPYNIAKSYAPIQVKTPQSRNYAANRSKKVAWLVSNCYTENRRLEYAEYLGQFIQVDIYGDCGLKSCPPGNACLEMLGRDYKFYLSFKNSNCKDYITEKFFLNGLRYNILPIVMGPPRQDYERVAPPHSFIHVNDFPSAKELAEYLDALDQNDTLYNEYFEWKSKGEFINTYFWCRLCAMLHAPQEYRSYADMKMWWSGPGICQA